MVYSAPVSNAKCILFLYWTYLGYKFEGKLEGNDYQERILLFCRIMCEQFASMSAFHAYHLPMLQALGSIFSCFEGPISKLQALNKQMSAFTFCPFTLTSPIFPSFHQAYLIIMFGKSLWKVYLQSPLSPWCQLYSHWNYIRFKLQMNVDMLSVSYLYFLFLFFFHTVRTQLC